MKQHFRDTDIDLSPVIDRLDELSYRFLKALIKKHDYSKSDRTFNKAVNMAERKALKTVKNIHFMRSHKRIMSFMYRMTNGEYCCTVHNHLDKSRPQNTYMMILSYRHVVKANNPGIMLIR